MNELLTIMIPTTIDRRALFEPLIMELWEQIFNNNAQHLVNIIYEEDDKQISVGAKRQKLLERATGEYVVGFDSDDWPADTYIADILAVLIKHQDVDHVGFLEQCNIDGKQSLSIFSIQHLKWEENAYGYDHIRCANPKSVIKRSKAIQVGFQDLRYGEDRIFSEAITPLLSIEVFIDKVLYHYRHTSSDHNERYGIK